MHMYKNNILNTVVDCILLNSSNIMSALCTFYTVFILNSVSCIVVFEKFYLNAIYAAKQLVKQIYCVVDYI